MDTDSQYIIDTNSANQFPYRTVSHRSKILAISLYTTPLSIWLSGFRDFFFNLFCLKKEMSLACDQFEPQVRGWVNV